MLENKAEVTAVVSLVLGVRRKQKNLQIVNLDNANLRGWYMQFNTMGCMQSMDNKPYFLN